MSIMSIIEVMEFNRAPLPTTPVQAVKELKEYLEFSARAIAQTTKESISQTHNRREIMKLEQEMEKWEIFQKNIQATLGRMGITILM